MIESFTCLALGPLRTLCLLFIFANLFTILTAPLWAQQNARPIAPNASRSDLGL